METNLLTLKLTILLAIITAVSAAGFLLANQFTPSVRAAGGTNPEGSAGLDNSQKPAPVPETLTSEVTNQKNLMSPPADCKPFRSEPDPKLIIDDYSTGPFESGTIYDSGIDEIQTQSITSNFPQVTVRTIRFRVVWPAHTSHPSTLVVGQNLEHDDIVDTDGLSVANGPRVRHHLQVFYGKNLAGSNEALDLDLHDFQGFRVNFESNDNRLHMHMTYYSASGVKHSGIGRTVQRSHVPCSVDIPFTDFNRVSRPELSPDPSDVDYIVLQLQPIEPLTSDDHKIRSIGVY